jgi:hypothetical protein
MRRLLAGWLVFTGLATVALLIAHYFAPGRFELELDVYILAVGGLALLEVVILAREAYPREQGSALAAALERDPVELSRPPEIEQLERELTLATGTAFDLHARLRPTLREIATMRLATRGVTLDEEGEAIVGEELWELVRPDRRPPTDRHAPGIAPEAVRRIVERLEAL